MPPKNSNDFNARLFTYSMLYSIHIYCMLVYTVHARLCCMLVFTVHARTFAHKYAHTYLFYFLYTCFGF